MYGYDLAVPQTYAQFRDIAEWFYRPAANPPLYGVAVYTQKDYDALTMGVQQAMFAYGGEWHNVCNNVGGVVNSPRNVEAIQIYKTLFSLGPPDNASSFFTEMNDYFINGKVAVTMNYFPFLTSLADPGSNPYATKTGFFANPAGPHGDRGASMGGQAISVNAHCAPERIQAAFDFIEWFARDDVQAKWAQLGGLTCNKQVLASPEFLASAPYHPVYAESMAMMKDFWNIPEYGALLEPSQHHLYAFVVENLGTAQWRLDQIALEHQQILTNAGYSQRCRQHLPLVLR
jgi:multiple sugar transport system substrate-binding protein